MRLLLPWVPAQGERQLPRAFRLCFFALAASQTLPMTAFVQIIYRKLDLSAEIASQYFLAEFIPSFAAPIFGLATDWGGQNLRRYTVVGALVCKVISCVAFAAGVITSVQTLFVFGVMQAVAHAVALASIDGAMCSNHRNASGDTSTARSQQAAKLAWQTLGDLTASILSIIFAAAQVSLSVVFLTAAFINLAAVSSAIGLPRSNTGDISKVQSYSDDHQGDGVMSGHSSNAAHLLGGESELSESVSMTQPITRRLSKNRACVGALTGALLVAIFMMPPTSNVAMGSYVGRTNATSAWVISAQQVTGMIGGLGGVSVARVLDLPLVRSLCFGAITSAASQITSLAVFTIGGNSGVKALDTTPWHLFLLLVEPAISSALRICGVVAVLAACAVAAEGKREGAAYGLVGAASGASSVAAGSLSAIMLHWLRIGNPPHDGSWKQLPLFAAICAVCKLATIPTMLFVLWLRKRFERSP